MIKHGSSGPAPALRCRLNVVVCWVSEEVFRGVGQLVDFIRSRVCGPFLSQETSNRSTRSKFACLSADMVNKRSEHTALPISSLGSPRMLERAV